MIDPLDPSEILMAISPVIAFLLDRLADASIERHEAGRRRSDERLHDPLRSADPPGHRLPRARRHLRG